jgi:S2P endopeptidase
MCLNIRKTIENSFDYCNKAPSCREGRKCHKNPDSSVEHPTSLPVPRSLECHCFKPIINNFTTILQIKRLHKPDVIYIGHSSDVPRSVQISQFVPKTRVIGSGFADAYSLLLKYITVFSFGLAIINAIPCFGFDGQHIVKTILVNVLLTEHSKQKRDLISLCVNIIGTLFVFILLIKVMWLTTFQAIM